MIAGLTARILPMGTRSLDKRKIEKGNNGWTTQERRDGPDRFENDNTIFDHRASLLWLAGINFREVPA